VRPLLVNQRTAIVPPVVDIVDAGRVDGDRLETRGHAHLPGFENVGSVPSGIAPVCYDGRIP
jgi:hypothetical protein